MEGSGAVTVTVHVAVLFPSSVVAVMIAVPSEIPVTTPSVTVAISGLSLAHVIAVLVAFAGSMDAVSVIVLLIDIVAVSDESVIPVTEISPPNL